MRSEVDCECFGMHLRYQDLRFEDRARAMVKTLEWLALPWVHSPYQIIRERSREVAHICSTYNRILSAKPT